MSAGRRVHLHLLIPTASFRFRSRVSSDRPADYHIKLRAPDGKVVDAEYDQSGRKLSH